jgi:glycosyltransferase involved in cell wall biosynthesis
VDERKEYQVTWKSEITRSSVAECVIDYANIESLKAWTALQSERVSSSYFTAGEIVKVFGTFAAPYDLADLEEVPSEGVYGLSVFAKRFLRSLLLHSDFDEFHFFCSSSYREPRSDELLGSDNRVRLVHLREFSASAREFDYHVLHNIWTPDIGPWTEMRNRLSPGVPVTGLTHTISYQSFLPRVLSTMVMGAHPFDSIICTADSARTVMLNWIEHLQREFGAQTGAKVRYDGRLDKIPLGVDAEIFTPKEKAPLRQRLELPAADVLVLYVGRFSHCDKMDLFPLLLAFKSVVERSPAQSVSLVMAGSDGQHKYAGLVDQFAADLGLAGRVIVRTNLPDQDVLDYYAASDIFISPSDNLQETFGQSIIEAMSCGLPVICSDWNGYKELVEHELTGLRVPTYWMQCDQKICDHAGLADWMADHFYLGQSVSVDVSEMVIAMARLIDNRGLRKQWGENGRKRVLEHFDWAVIIRQYLDLWQELKDLAVAAPITHVRRTSWYRPEFFQTFRHYPTQILDPSVKVITHGSLNFKWYPELSAEIRPDLVEQITKAAISGLTLRELEQLVGGNGVTLDSLRFHIMWLLKYQHLILS